MPSGVPLDLDGLELPASEPEAARGTASGRRWLVALLVVVILSGAGWWKRETLAGWVGERSAAGGSASKLLTCVASPIDLRVTVLESGTLESASSIDVFSEVEGQTAIIGLVPEGQRVEAGDLVVELDSSALRRRRVEQQIVVEKARAMRSQAQQEDVVAQSLAESDVRSAELALELAKLDLQKYLEGEYPLQLRSLQTETALAEEELERARVQLQFSEDLRKDGFLQQGDVEADRFKVVQAEYRVEIAKERETVLETYTSPRTRRELTSSVDESERALDRARSVAASAVERAKAALKAQESTLALEESTLTHIEDQLEKCRMLAPQAGVVVYPIPEDDDLVELFIKQGTVIRERQHVFSIPDTDVLQVSTSIHEAVVNKVRPGMQARVWVDVYPDLELSGEVARVSPLPEPEDWRKSTVKFYETTVTLLDQAEGLRPGMSTKLEILIDRQRDALAVPVTAVVQKGERGLAYVMTDGRPEPRALRLGKSNFASIAVLDGLAAGDVVVQSPDLLGVPPGFFEETETQFEWKPTKDVAVAEASAPKDEQEPEVETEYEAVCLGPGNAIAQVEYEIKVRGDEVTGSELEVTVQGGEPNAELEVSVDGVVVGSVTLDETGAAKVSWSSKHDSFPPKFPPDAGPGSSVQVGKDLTGTLSL